MGRRPGAKRQVPLTAAQQRQVVDHLYVVAWVISALRQELEVRERRGGDPEEPPAWGEMGLVLASQTYEPPAATMEAVIAEFESYAWWRVRGSIRDELRKELRIRLNEELGFGEDAADEQSVYTAAGDALRDSDEEVQRRIEENLQGCAAAFLSGVAAAAQRMDPETALIYARAWAEIQRRIDRLPDRQRDLVERRLLREDPWERILADTGLKKATAERHYARALERLFAPDEPARGPRAAARQDSPAPGP